MRNRNPRYQSASELFKFIFKTQGKNLKSFFSPHFGEVEHVNNGWEVRDKARKK